MRRSKRGDAERDPHVAEHAHVRRQPIPSARAILWKPLPDSYHLLVSMMRTTDQQTHLFITQRAFLQVERHLRSAPELELGGFLAGHLYECPRTRARYSIVNTVVPFADVSADAIGGHVTEESYQAVRTRLNGHRLFLIGWYRNGMGLGLQLLPDDVEAHVRYFDKPWQTTMLVLPDPAKSKGAFFTYDPRVGRSYCIPFYELLDAGTADAQRVRRTCVGWTTYVPSIPVDPLPPEDREIVETVVRPIRNDPEAEPPEPIDEWWDAIKDPWVRLKYIAVTAARREEEEAPLVWQPTSGASNSSSTLDTAARPSASVLERPTPEARPAGPRAPAPDERPVASRAPAPRSAAPMTPSHPVPPFAGPARQAAGSTARPEPVARAAKPEAPPAASPPPAPPHATHPRPEPRRSPPKPRRIPLETAAAMARAAAPTTTPRAGPVPYQYQILTTNTTPAVEPEDEGESLHEDAIRWRRRRRIGFTVAALSFLAGIVLWTLRSRPEQIAQAATSAGVTSTTTAGDAGAVMTPPEPNGHGPVPLAAAVQSLSSAIVYYRAMDEDHRRGRVGCPVLGRAHSLVVRARTQVDSSRARAGGTLEAADSLRVSMLGAEYTHITQMYRRSGCQS